VTRLRPVTPVRLLLDEMISPRVAQQLRRRGHDVESVAERSDLVGASDDDLLTHAAGEERLLVTLNVADFIALDRDWRTQRRDHAGIVIVASSAFAQDRSLVGALVTSLASAAAQGTLPGHGQVRFLARR